MLKRKLSLWRNVKVSRDKKYGVKSKLHAGVIQTKKGSCVSCVYVNLFSLSSIAQT